MLETRVAIMEAAQQLADQLEAKHDESKGAEWTQHVFSVLREFCQQQFNLKASDCFHKNHPEGNGEFLWDFLAISPESGTVLIAESEQDVRSVVGLRHDFEKLLYAYAPLRIFVCKAKVDTDVDELIRGLQTFAGSFAYSPGAIFLIHISLWGDRGLRTFVWQADGDPAPLIFEPMRLKLLK